MPNPADSRPGFRRWTARSFLRRWTKIRPTSRFCSVDSFVSWCSRLYSPSAWRPRAWRAARPPSSRISRHSRCRASRPNSGSSSSAPQPRAGLSNSHADALGQGHRARPHVAPRIRARLPGVDLRDLLPVHADSPGRACAGARGAGRPGDWRRGSDRLSCTRTDRFEGFSWRKFAKSPTFGALGGLIASGHTHSLVFLLLASIAGMRMFLELLFKIVVPGYAPGSF